MNSNAVAVNIEIFNEGTLSFDAGVSIHLCPYKSETLTMVWEAGWLEGKKEYNELHAIENEPTEAEDEAFFGNLSEEAYLERDERYYQEDRQEQERSERHYQEDREEQERIDAELDNLPLDKNGEDWETALRRQMAERNEY